MYLDLSLPTTQKMVQMMEAKYGKAKRIWVMDRGMVSEDNLDYMTFSSFGAVASIIIRLRERLLWRTPGRSDSTGPSPWKKVESRIFS